MVGAKNSYVATLVERHSRFLMLIKVPGKETEAVVAALSQHVRKLPATLRRSLTWDRGLEMAKHKEFTMATDVQVYFCNPQSPWRNRATLGAATLCLCNPTSFLLSRFQRSLTPTVHSAGCASRATQ